MLGDGRYLFAEITRPSSKQEVHKVGINTKVDMLNTVN